MLEEVKTILIEELQLEDVKPEDIDVDAQLFGGGLGLDSIDALELAITLERAYGVRIKSGDSRNAEILSSLGSLVKFIEENRTK
ncbi:MAG: acyl carrier protein [Zetaproteobacteria bacterium]|nr:MAG: acyl carrier protein [Zetaproteobacteria bacterium]